MQFGLFQLQCCIILDQQKSTQADLENELSEHSECSHGRSQVQWDGQSTLKPESSQIRQVFAKQTGNCFEKSN